MHLTAILIAVFLLIALVLPAVIAARMFITIFTGDSKTTGKKDIASDDTEQIADQKPGGDKSA